MSDMFHHVFALDSYFGGYLGHVSDAPGGLCLVAVSYLDNCVFHVLISSCGLWSGYISALQLEKYKRELAGLQLQNNPSNAETSHALLRT